MEGGGGHGGERLRLGGLGGFWATLDLGPGPALGATGGEIVVDAGHFFLLYSGSYSQLNWIEYYWDYCKRWTEDHWNYVLTCKFRLRVQI